MTDADHPISSALEAYRAAVFAKDLDAFVALYDADLRVFDMWGPWSHDGIEAWRAMAAAWFGSLGSERVVVEFSDVQASITPDLAVGHAFVTYRAETADGVALRSLNSRLTVVLRPRGDVWKIVHEHSSAPVDADTGQVSLKR